jgi:hypothetical protein
MNMHTNLNVVCLNLWTGIAETASEAYKPTFSVEDRSQLEHNIDSPLTDVDLSFVFEETDALMESLFQSEHELLTLGSILDSRYCDSCMCFYVGDDRFPSRLDAGESMGENSDLIFLRFTAANRNMHMSSS